MHKLKKDSFIFPIPANDKNFVTSSFEVMSFLKNGGYTRQNLYKRLKTFAYILNITILCGAASVAGVYSVLQISKESKQQIEPCRQEKLLQIKTSIDSVKNN
ncbi:MAG TPA: hypothetical protein VF411_08285 [Bacteroidia bacterium]